MWALLGQALKDPAGAALVFLAIAACIYAAVAYRQTVCARARHENANGNGDQVDEERKDLEGLGRPSGPRRGLVTRDVFDTSISGVHRRIDRVKGEGTELRERLVVVEQTCKRTETEVKALPETFRNLLAAQTVQLEQSSGRQILAAFEALDKQTGERIDALRKELNGKA